MLWIICFDLFVANDVFRHAKNMPCLILYSKKNIPEDTIPTNMKWME